MFPVDFSCDNIYGLMSSKEESTDVWHQRYGHFARKSFPVAQAKRAEEKLELVHADIWGPMKTDSYAGSVATGSIKYAVYSFQFVLSCSVNFLQQQLYENAES
ncbi:hypothetical protein Tco_0591138 [Tanacetum coccineum]